MSGVNKAILIGRLGKDPEVGTIPNTDTTVASFSIATSDKWKDKQTGEQKEKTVWHNVKAYGRLAEIIRDYVNKGSQVYIDGSMENDKYQDKDGKDKYFSYVKARQMQMLDSKGSGGGNSEAKDPSSYAPAAQEEPFTNDDIPF